MKKIKELTKAQLKANARNQLFRQIHGFNLRRFAVEAAKHNALASWEKLVLREILNKLEYLKSFQFDGSKEVGLNPRRRCPICNGIARWKVITVLGDEKHLCNKHKQEYEEENGLKEVHSIDPYK